MPEWKEVLGVTPLIAFFLICAWVCWKALPAWKEIRLAEIQLRKDEIALRHEEAAVIGGLTEIFRAQGDVIEELKIFLRAATRKHDLIEQRMTAVEEKVTASTGTKNNVS
jgi:hypothetical protein